MTSQPPVIAVLGLGEAGSRIAADLAAAGATVRGYDPAVPVPTGVSGCAGDADACRGATVVLSLTCAHEAEAALDAALPGIGPGVLYADLNTGSPGLKERLASRAAAAGLEFADVALMSPVPGRGLRTPMLTSGTAAAAFADALTPLGADVQVLPGPPGSAAARKLVRSVFYKGMAAAVTEALRAGQAAGCEPWLRATIAAEFEAAGPETLDRLESASVRRARRRADEMTAAAELLHALGVPARITTASADWLRDLIAIPGSDS